MIEKGRGIGGFGEAEAKHNGISELLALLPAAYNVRELYTFNSGGVRLDGGVVD
jgi:hypothetical protein